MTYNYAYPNNSCALTPQQKHQNVQIALCEIGKQQCSAGRHHPIPVYKTVKKITIKSAYELFGLGDTSLYKLTLSASSKYLPDLIVIHCNGSIEKNDDTPVMLNNTLFVSHLYFMNWITSKNPETFELEILEMVMKQIDMVSPSYN